MSYNKIEIEIANGVGIIRLNDPERLNATTRQMLEELHEAVGKLESETAAIVLTTKGRAFCAGAGLDRLGEDAADVGIGLETHVNPLLRTLRDLDVPWISAVRGAVVGVGCGLALSADLIIASESAFFLQGFARVGLVPDGGSTYLLTRALTRNRAMEMMLLADKLSAKQAHEWGLVNRVVPDADLESAACEIAARLARGPKVALGMMRRMVWKALDSPWEACLKAEREAQRAAGNTEDFKEGLAAFLEKRPPAFKGR
ncbi:MAG TPA: enoyl-CoA hydratase-related protein [Steroidobacteraceae bacterium]|nr:enoyl-CoA hydratase-related protein [Steroidobacteraceae bacterium]